MFARPSFAFLAVAVGVFLAGCNLGSSGQGELVEVTQRVRRGVTPGQRTLVLDSYNGDVTLQDTTAREADLVFVKHARAESRKKARAMLKKVRIEERGGESEFAYKLSSSTSSRTSVDVHGSVPQRTGLRLHLQNGDVALSGVQGPLDVQNENGDVRIGGAARKTHAETRNGTVEVGMSGFPQKADLRLRTANGDLQLTLPGTASASIEARTDAGEITVSGLALGHRDRSRSGAGARLEGRLGDGGAPVNLRTQNGDITLRQGTVRHLPGVGGGPSGAAPDTSGLDSLFTPPAGGATPGGATRDTSRGLLDTSAAGRSPRGAQPPVPYSDTPPPLLRRPSQPRSSQPADGSRRPVPVPGVPSLGRDTLGP